MQRALYTAIFSLLVVVLVTGAANKTITQVPVTLDMIEGFCATRRLDQGVEVFSGSSTYRAYDAQGNFLKIATYAFPLTANDKQQLKTFMQNRVLPEINLSEGTN